jgi:succinyl-diaminopimelate desuccinylase
VSVLSRAVLATAADDLLALTEALVATPSVSLKEAMLASSVEARLQQRAPHLALARVGSNVVARTDHGRGRRVILAGHLDTVPPKGNETPRRDGDVLWGLGTADMKGGLAVMLRLAEELADAATHDVTLVFYAAEEIADEHNGLRALFADHADLVAGDLAICLEPTDGWLEAGCQATVHVRGVVTGAAAHTARPWMGRNAVHGLAPILARIAAYEAPIVEVDGLGYQESLQVVGIDGGQARNVVPDRASVLVNHRCAPSRGLDEAIAETRALLAGADEIVVEGASPAAPPNLGHPLIAQLVGDLGLPVRPKLGWTDVARFSAHGIPAVNYGPGDAELAHTADESVTGASLDRCHDTLRRLLWA